MGHAVKCCLLSMRLADILNLSVQQKSDLYYATLLKDAGCSSNAARMYEILGGDERKAKQEVKATDWTKASFEGLEYLLRNVLPGRSRLERVFAIASVATNRDAQTRELIDLRCDRGAQIVKKIGFSDSTTTAIFSLDEHWNGKGFPAGRKGQEIPLFSRTMNLCQTLEVFVTLNGVSDGFQVLRDRSGSWFDPELVRAVGELEKDSELWKLIEQDRVREAVMEMEPISVSLYADEAKLDNVCEAFANVIDIKSPYTHSHSRGVTSIAVAICQRLALPEDQVTQVRRAALLHDLTRSWMPVFAVIIVMNFAIIGLSALRTPLLVLTGDRDESFHADQYGPTIAPHAAGTFRTLPGVTHIGLVVNPRTAEEIEAWLDRLP